MRASENSLSLLPPPLPPLPLTPVYVDSAVVGSRENNGKLVYHVLIYTKTMFLLTSFWWFLFQTSNTVSDLLFVLVLPVEVFKISDDVFGM